MVSIPDPVATGPDIYQFWAAVAQIVPVLAIPLVFEARALASRESTKSERRSRLRLVWGIVLSVLAVSIIWIELTALSIVAFGGAVEWLAVAALVVISGALAVIFILPLSLIISALSAETMWKLQMRLPWHQLQKMKRASKRGLRSSKAREGQYMGLRIDAVGMVANHLASDARKKHVAKLVRDATSRQLDPDPAKDAKAKADISAMLTEFETDDPSLAADIQKTVDTVDAKIEETRKQQRAWAALIDDMEKLIRSGATDQQLQELNNRLRELGAS